MNNAGLKLDSPERLKSKRFTGRALLILFIVIMLVLGVEFTATKFKSRQMVDANKRLAERDAELEQVSQEVELAIQTADQLRAQDSKKQAQISRVCSASKGIENFPVDQGPFFVVVGSHRSLRMFVPDGKHTLSLKLGACLRTSGDKKEFQGEPFCASIELPPGTACELSIEKTQNPETNILKVNVTVTDSTGEKLFVSGDVNVKLKGKLRSSGIGSAMDYHLFRPGEYVPMTSEWGNRIKPLKIRKQSYRDVNIGDSSRTHYFGVELEVNTAGQPPFVPEGQLHNLRKFLDVVSLGWNDVIESEDENGRFPLKPKWHRK